MRFREKGWLFTLLLLVATFSTIAQPSSDNCLNAQALCPNITFSSSNIDATTEVCAGCADGATVNGAFCFGYDNTVWYSFTTNANGGSADVVITNISCLSGSGQDNTLEGVIIEAGTPCDESTYTSVSNCETGQASNFTLSAAALAPNTTYWVQIDGGFDAGNFTSAAECDFDIQVTGPAVEYVVDVNVTDQSCGTVNGEIEVVGVSGGTGPYQYSIDGTTYQQFNIFGGLAAGNYTLTIQDAQGCIYTVTPQIEIEMTGGPTVTVNITDVTDCNNGNGEVDIIAVGGTPPYTYTFNGNASGPNITNLDGGNYTITVEDANGCITTVDSIIVNAPGLTSAYYIIEQPPCGGGGTGFITFPVVGSGNPYTFTLTGPIGTVTQPGNLFTGLPVGTYDVLITDAVGCTFTISNIILEEAPGTLVPSVTITASPNPACQGDDVTFTASVTNGGSNPNFEWFVNGASVQNSSSDTYTGTMNDDDVVYCYITSDDPCAAILNANSNYIAIVVDQPESPTVTVTASETDICLGETVIFVADTQGCANGGTLEWFLNGVSGGGNGDSLSTAAMTNGDEIVATYTCNSGCASSATSNPATVNVTEVTVDAGADVSILFGESTTLTATGSGGSDYMWSPSTGLNSTTTATTTASPDNTTTYVVTLTNGDCIAMDEVTVVVSQPILPPNTFTPNGDGANDTWFIIGIEDYPDSRVRIFNRWGQRVFNSIGYGGEGNVFDGTVNGTPLPVATYYYTISLDGSDKKETMFTGSVTIVR